MSADLHAALAEVVESWRQESMSRVGGDYGLERCAREALALLAAHPATDADLIAEAEDRGYEKGLLAPGSSWMKTRAEDIAEAEQRGAAAVIERVEAVLAE